METGHPEKILEHLTVNDPQGYPIPPPTWDLTWLLSGFSVLSRLDLLRA